MSNAQRGPADECAIEPGSMVVQWGGFKAHIRRNAAANAA
jgi:hypothetical protein